MYLNNNSVSDPEINKLANDALSKYNKKFPNDLIKVSDKSSLTLDQLLLLCSQNKKLRKKILTLLIINATHYQGTSTPAEDVNEGLEGFTDSHDDTEQFTYIEQITPVKSEINIDLSPPKTQATPETPVYDSIDHLKQIDLQNISIKDDIDIETHYAMLIELSIKHSDCAIEIYQEKELWKNLLASMTREEKIAHQSKFAPFYLSHFTGSDKILNNTNFKLNNAKNNYNALHDLIRSENNIVSKIYLSFFHNITTDNDDEINKINKELTCALIKAHKPLGIIYFIADLFLALHLFKNFFTKQIIAYEGFTILEEIIKNAEPFNSELHQLPERLPLVISSTRSKNESLHKLVAKPNPTQAYFDKQNKKADEPNINRKLNFDETLDKNDKGEQNPGCFPFMNTMLTRLGFFNNPKQGMKGVPNETIAHNPSYSIK